MKMRRSDTLLRNTCKNWQLLLMALPGIVLMFMFTYMPMAGLSVAFKDYDFVKGIFGSEWIGLKNFEILLASKETTFRIVRNTVLYWCLFTAVGTTMNIAIAIMIYECTSKWYGKISHMIMIFPTFVSWVAISYIVKAYLNSGNGMFNNILTSIGLQPLDWYLTPEYWPVILLIVNVWKGCGYGAVIYLSALSGIDTSLFEAADLDGATKMQRIRYITLPLLKSMVIIQLLLSLGGIMHSNTGLFYQVTRNTGILYPTTQTVDAYIMNAITEGGNLGATTAVSLFQAVIGAVMVLLVNWIVRRKDEESALF